MESVVPPVTRAEIDDFLAQPALAVVGASRDGRKFGSAAYRELRAHGRRVYAVHPSATLIEGDPVVHSLYELPEPVDGVLIVVPPEETERVVHEVAEAGIRRVWMQQGAQSLRRHSLLRRARHPGHPRPVHFDVPGAGEVLPPRTPLVPPPRGSLAAVKYRAGAPGVRARARWDRLRPRRPLHPKAAAAARERSPRCRGLRRLRRRAAPCARSAAGPAART